MQPKLPGATLNRFRSSALRPDHAGNYEPSSGGYFAVGSEGVEALQKFKEAFDPKQKEAGK